MSEAADPPEVEDRLGMTPEQWELFQAYTRGYGEQDANGIDVSLLRRNLLLTPTERVRGHLWRGLFSDRAQSMVPNEAFEAILSALQAQNVRYVLIGGLAMISHGSDQLTRDVDICYSRDPANLEAVVRALAPLHPRLRGAPEGLPFIWDARTLRSGSNFTLTTDIIDLDLLGYAAGAESFDDLYARAKEVELLGIPVRVASVDDLISMKRAAGRAKDQTHLMELERLRALLSEAAPNETEENSS